MSVYVIVDDSDPNIIYSPRSPVTGQAIDVDNEADGWLVGGVADARAFLTTISGTGKASSTMSYHFNGSSIAVYATISGLNEEFGITSTDVSFSIDGTVVNQTTFDVPFATMRHVLAFTSPSLSTSEIHTLGMEVLSSETSTNVSSFRFDYMIYDAPINSSISVSSTSSLTNWIFLDDRSPYLVYTPDDGWSGDVLDFPASDVNTLDDAVFNSTTMGPTTSGNISLNFTGASFIRAYGMLISNPTSGFIGTYTIDRQAPRSLNVPSTTPSYNFMLLSEDIITSGDSHILTISAAEANAFYLDYVLLGAESAYVTWNSSETTTAGASTTTGPGIVPTQSSTPGITPTQSSASGIVPTQSSTQSSNGTGHNIGAIAGGVVAGTMVLVAVVLVVIFCARRREKLQQRPVHILGQQVDAYPSRLVPLTREVGGSEITHTTRIRERPRTTSIVGATGETPPALSSPTQVTRNFTGEPSTAYINAGARTTVADIVDVRVSEHNNNLHTSNRIAGPMGGGLATGRNFEVNSNERTMSPPPRYTPY